MRGLTVARRQPWGLSAFRGQRDEAGTIKPIEKKKRLLYQVFPGIHMEKMLQGEITWNVDMHLRWRMGTSLLVSGL